MVSMTSSTWGSVCGVEGVSESLVSDHVSDSPDDRGDVLYDSDGEMLYCGMS